MTVFDNPTGKAADPIVGSSGLRFELDLHPTGWTKSIRLSACTLREAVQVCAPALWQAHAVELVRELALPASQEAANQPIDHVELTLYEDGSPEQIRFYGCTTKQSRLLSNIAVKLPATSTRPVDVIT
jgi:hypothetical protein